MAMAPNRFACLRKIVERAGIGDQGLSIMQQLELVAEVEQCWRALEKIQLLGREAELNMTNSVRWAGDSQSFGFGMNGISQLVQMSVATIGEKLLPHQKREE